MALSLPGWATTAGAQSPAAWPQKTIKILVPNPAGGSADLFPRLVSEALSSKLGQTIVIENKPGAAGNIAAEMLFNAEPDGYTLMAAPPPPLSINVSLYPKLNYDPAKFVPITVFSLVPNALMVHPSVPANSVQELIAYAKANPDKLSYASQGNGSTAHLTAELFKQKTGTKLVHVPYKGDAPAVADLLAGHVNVMFGNVAQASAHLRSGKLKVLAVTSAKRIPSMPQTPALQEIVPGVVAVAWFALVAPPKTPMAIAQRLSGLIGDILRTPEMMRRFAEVGAEPVGNTPEEMAQWMKEDTERWRQVIKNGGVTID
ncbi:MAG: tripartite tricarboxylate transporter substrate binding protein [Limnohabitans sp.]|nr:tripartite tricarboxylate transporter substrate binding protein [Limnohabitans sp.]